MSRELCVHGNNPELGICVHCAYEVKQEKKMDKNGERES